MNEAVKMDRSVDRNRIQAQMDEYARHGGLISKLDSTGQLVGLESVKPSAKILPFKRPAPAPVEVIQEAPVLLRVKFVAVFAPTVEATAPLALPVKNTDFAPTAMIAELRSIRADANRALARLNAVFSAGDAQ